MIVSILAGAAALVLGVLAEATVGVSWNMHGIGGMVSASLIGAIILWNVRQLKK